LHHKKSNKIFILNYAFEMKTITPFLFFLLSLPCSLQVAQADDQTPGCAAAKKVLSRYFELNGDSKSANQEGLIDNDGDGGTDYSLISSAPQIDTCEDKDGKVVITVKSLVYAELSSGGYYGQYALISKAKNSPDHDSRDFHLRQRAGKWKISIHDLDPPYTNLAVALAVFKKQQSRCATPDLQKKCAERHACDPKVEIAACHQATQSALDRLDAWK
jgi:hypothetical protein